MLHHRGFIVVHCHYFFDSFSPVHIFASNARSAWSAMPRAGRGTAAAEEMSEAPMARDLGRWRVSKKALPERDSSPAAAPRRSRRRTRGRSSSSSENNLPILRPVFPLDLRSQQDRPVCLWHRSARGPAVLAQVLAGRSAMARLSVLIVGIVHNARYTLHRTIAHMRSSASQFAEHKLVVIENDSTDGDRGGARVRLGLGFLP